MVRRKSVLAKFSAILFQGKGLLIPTLVSKVESTDVIAFCLSKMDGGRGCRVGDCFTPSPFASLNKTAY